MYLQVPERYKPGIQKLISIEEDGFNAIVLVLQNLHPTLDPIFEISRKLLETQRVDRADAFDIASLVVSIYGFREEEEVSPEEISEAVVKSLAEDAQYSEIPQRDLTRLQKRLELLLEINSSLEVSRKASSLIVEYERLYADSKIVTDMRPIFDSENESKLEAAIVVHTMKIVYQDLEGPKEFFVAINSDDLEGLHDQIVIALENRRSMEFTLEKLGIKCVNSSFEPEGEEEIKEK